MPQEHFTLGTTPVRSVLAYRQGQRGFGTFQLQLGLEWHPQRHGGVLARAQVPFVGTFGVSFQSGMRYPIGVLQCLYPFELPPEDPGSATAARVDVVAYIGPEQLDRLEEVRSGGAISLHLELNGLLFMPAQGARPVAFRADLGYDLTAAEWVDQLERWQYAKGFLVQVPTFPPSQSPQMAKVQATVERAIREMNEGDYGNAVALCRDALEQSFGSDDANAHPELGYSVPGLRTADKTARFWLVRRGLWAVTHAAKHADDITDQIEWRRADAVAAISILTSLLYQAPPS